MKKWIYYLLLGAALASAVWTILAWLGFMNNCQTIAFVKENSWVFYEWLVYEYRQGPELLTIISIVLHVNAAWAIALKYHGGKS